MTVKRSMLRARTAGDIIDRKNRERSISVNCFFLTFERRGAIGGGSVVEIPEEALPASFAKSSYSGYRGPCNNAVFNASRTKIVSDE